MLWQQRTLWAHTRLFTQSRLPFLSKFLSILKEVYLRSKFLKRTMGLRLRAVSVYWWAGTVASLGGSKSQGLIRLITKPVITLPSSHNIREMSQDYIPVASGCIRSQVSTLSFEHGWLCCWTVLIKTKNSGWVEMGRNWICRCVVTGVYWEER